MAAVACSSASAPYHFASSSCLLSLSCLRLPICKQLPQGLLALLRACWQPFQALCLGSCPVVTASWLNRCCRPQLSSLQVDTVECWLLQQPEEEDPLPSGRAGSVLDRQGLQFTGSETAGPHRTAFDCLCTLCSLRTLLRCSLSKANTLKALTAWDSVTGARCMQIQGGSQLPADCRSHWCPAQQRAQGRTS